MKKFKNILSMAIVLFFLFGAVSAWAVDIGVAWSGKSGMTRRVVAGFDRGIKEFAPDMKIEYHKELPTMDALAEIAVKFQKEKDGMLILRSNGAKWLGKNPPSIPTFIGGCNNPVQLGTVKNMAAPEGNITGVTYYLPVSTSFETFQAILPEMKSVLLLMEGDHPSSKIDEAETREICTGLGLEYHQKTVLTGEEAAEAAKSFSGKVSAIIIGNQGLVIDNASNIVAAAGKTPVFSYSSKPVKDGALGGFVADDGVLGYMLARSVADVLVKGKSIKDTPVKVDPNPKFYVNAKSAEALGIEIPYEILDAAEVIE